MDTIETKPQIVTVTDAEGDGSCGHCQREGLRWIVTLSDGTEWGSGCVKKALGIKATVGKGMEWTARYRVVARHTEIAGNGDRAEWALWQHKAGRQTRTTRNGELHGVGGQREEWEKDGWI